MKDLILKEVSRRNTETFEQVAKELYSMLYDKQTQIDQLNNGIATLQNRLNSLEQQLIIQKVQLTGLGPSVKD